MIELCDEKTKKKCDSFYKEAFLKRNEYINKLEAENTMLKSDNYILKNKSKENDKKYLKIIEEKNKRIQELEKELSTYKSKQVDMFEV